MKDIKLVIHCADIHIRNVQRHEEYAQQLERFVEKCKEIAAPYQKEEVRILICGDLVHSKNQISNELIVFASVFLRKLEQIAKVIVISGNHDLVVDNQTRTDTLTALFETARFSNCYFFDKMLGYKSGCITDANIVWALYSIYDDFMAPSLDTIKEYKEKGSKIIGLYHGSVVGARLQNGTVMDNGLKTKAFEGCDIVMAGHLHLRQTLHQGSTPIVYPSSLLQQTFGETVKAHGFAVWNIENMSVEFIDLETNYGLYAMEIDSVEDIDNDKEKYLNLG